MSTTQAGDARPAGGLVRLDVRGELAVITLDRPERLNAMGVPMRAQIGAHLDAVEADANVRVLLIRAEGRSFCSGTDIEDAPDDAFGWRDKILLAQKHHAQIARMRKIVIAAVQGDAMGGGASLALSADILVMASDAKLGFPFVRLGVVPDGGASFFLVAKSRAGVALDVLLTGGSLDAAAAQAAGLTRRVVAPGELDTAAETLARELLALPPEAVMLTKAIATQTWATPMTQSFAHEADAFALASTTPSHRAALDGVKRRLAARR